MSCPGVGVARYTSGDFHPVIYSPRISYSRRAFALAFVSCLFIVILDSFWIVSVITIYLSVFILYPVPLATIHEADVPMSVDICVTDRID